MDLTLTSERRTDTRFGREVLGSIHATVRPGCAVRLIDLSAGGALVEANRPLAPGGRVHLQFDRGARRFNVGAHVLRCAVWALDADAGIVYRGALKFEQRCDGLWEAHTRGGYRRLPQHHERTTPGGCVLPDAQMRPESDGRWDGA